VRGVDGLAPDAFLRPVGFRRVPEGLRVRPICPLWGEEGYRSLNGWASPSPGHKKTGAEAPVLLKSVSPT
jgi:hypothetical protein